MVTIILTGAFPFESLIRATMLVIMALVVGTLAEYKNACNVEVIARNSELHASQHAFDTADFRPVSWTGWGPDSQKASC
jgi:hypothetical protein